MRKTYLIMVLGVLVSFGLGFGLGANLNAIGAIIPARFACPTPTLSAKARFLARSVSEEAIPSPEELEGMLAQRQGRAATPAWGVP